jgi:hypothetical protein
VGTELKLGALFGFLCQSKTTGETKVLASVVVKERSLDPRLPVSLHVQMPYQWP